MTVEAIDDAGNAAPGGPVTIAFNANESKQITNADLENGNNAKGLVGALGDGTGRWRLKVSSPLSITVQSLIRTFKAFITNMSAVAPSSGNTDFIYFFRPVDNPDQSSLLRLTNNGTTAGSLTIFGLDDAGVGAPGGTLTLTIGPEETIELTSSDLENGNPGKGLTGALGNGTGNWRLQVVSSLDITAMSIIETPLGFPTNLSAVAKEDATNTPLVFINPASVEVKESFIRVINEQNSIVSVTIIGFDDNGVSPGSNVSFNIAANAVRELTTSELENGGGDLVGALGDGFRKWRLQVFSGGDITVMSLLKTPQGFLTNQSISVDTK